MPTHESEAALLTVASQQGDAEGRGPAARLIAERWAAWPDLDVAEDFASFVQAPFAPGPAIAMTQQPTRRIEGSSFVALGWRIVERTLGEHWLNHGGGMAGYTSIVNVNLRRQRGVVVHSNLGNAPKLAENASQLGRDLRKNLEALP